MENIVPLKSFQSMPMVVKCNLKRAISVIQKNYQISLTIAFLFKQRIYNEALQRHISAGVNIDNHYIVSQYVFCIIHNFERNESEMFVIGRSRNAMTLPSLNMCACNLYSSLFRLKKCNRLKNLRNFTTQKYR